MHRDNNHSLWFRFSLSKAGMRYSILKALPNGRMKWSWKTRALSEWHDFSPNSPEAGGDCPGHSFVRSCHPFVTSRGVGQRRYPAKYWRGCRQIWSVVACSCMDYRLASSLFPCLSRKFSSSYQVRVCWGWGGWGGIVELNWVTFAQCCKEGTFSFSNLNKKKTLTGWDWLAFQVEVLTSQIMSPSTSFLHYFSPHPREIPALLSPNSNHEKNVFGCENARCPFPLPLAFTTVHTTSHIKSPSLSCVWMP